MGERKDMDGWMVGRMRGGIGLRVDGRTGGSMID